MIMSALQWTLWQSDKLHEVMPIRLQACKHPIIVQGRVCMHM